MQPGLPHHGPRADLPPATTEDATEEDPGYVVDMCEVHIPQAPTFAAPPSPRGANPNAARLWTLAGAPTFERGLVLDGVHQPGWRVSLPYE
ncbi:hypothetical protein [Pyxidicoccus fallax]|uniref:hypothetical protein n=1 Tax=Pyxidicoccus fallax TaxID=394095 RepID=UPI001FE73708|nr:hypothetical protein [Pyxidicoccus fallax]